MKKYLGPRAIVGAELTTFGEAKNRLGWKEKPEGLVEDLEEEGYIVEIEIGTELKRGWSEKKSFEAVYQLAEAMDFGRAIEVLKLGKKVARKGWNGKGMYVRLVKEWTYTDGIDDNRKCNPLLTIKNVEESVSTWVPSINDVLAEDWQIVE